MRQGLKEAKAAVAEYLRSKTEPVTMFSVSCVADSAVRSMRKSDLFPSLFDYDVVLPADWKVQWLGSTGGSDRIFYAIPRNWKPGETQSSSLLMPGAFTY